MNKPVSKVNRAFWIIAGLLLLVFIGKEYISYKLIEHHHKYTLGVITSFQNRLKSYDNFTYKYTVNETEYIIKSEGYKLDSSIVNKRIIVLYYPGWPKINQPKYEFLIPDSIEIQVPENGWDSVPKYIYNND
jgi:hypothetical protein